MRGLAKWIGGPVLSALLGYACIGPHFAGNSKPVKMVQEAKAAAQSRLLGKVPPSDDNAPGTKVDEPPAEPTKPSEAPAPRVSVGVKPVPADEPHPRRGRRHRRVTEPDEAPPELRPESDRVGPDPASTP